MNPATAKLAPSDDLPRLFEEFSKVTADLAASHDVLVEEVTQLRSELEAKNRRLEHKKRLEALGRVATGVAHEFRNPLGSIRLTIDALHFDATKESEQTTDSEVAARRDRLKHVSNAVEHLDQIVGELLTFTRDTRSDREMRTVGELIDLALEFAMVAETDVAIDVHGDRSTEVFIDRVQFVQIFANLISNAVQIGATRVGIEWGVRDDQLWFEVADDGPGVPEGEEERIFHPFHTLRDEGTGLGLSIVHSRVEAHEGDISVVHDSWGRLDELPGAHFRTTFPLLALRPTSEVATTSALPLTSPPTDGKDRTHGADPRGR